ncbi:unnamed protein product [Trichobilharzia szidati]|nr:unnamed protein product [Trichobilharzia szidati]
MSKNVENLKQEHIQDKLSNEKFTLYQDKYEALYFMDSTKELFHPLSGSTLPTSIIDVNQLNTSSSVTVAPSVGLHSRNFLPSDQCLSNSLSTYEYVIRTNYLTEHLSTNPQSASSSFQSLPTTNPVNSSDSPIDNNHLNGNINLLTNEQSTTSPSNMNIKIHNYMINNDSPHDLSYTNSTTPVSQSSHFKSTNECSSQDISEHLGMTYIDENGQNHIITTLPPPPPQTQINLSKLKLQRQQLQQQRQLHEELQRTQDSRREINFLCNQINKPMISPSLNDYNSNTDNYNSTHSSLPETHLPPVNSISEQFLSNLSTDLIINNSSIDPTVAAASNVMSYIHQHGPLNYGTAEQLKNLNYLDIRTLNHWNTIDFSLNGSIDHMTNYRESQVYDPNSNTNNNGINSDGNNSNNNVINTTNNGILRIDEANNLLKLHQHYQQNPLQSQHQQQLQSVNNSILSNSSALQTNSLKTYNGLITAFNVDEVRSGFQGNNELNPNSITNNNNNSEAALNVAAVGVTNSSENDENDVNMKNTTDSINISANTDAASNNSMNNGDSNSSRMRSTSFIENLNFRPQQQNCYSYNHSDGNFKPEIKNSTPGIQHMQGHPCRSVLMNSSLGSSHMNSGPFNLQKPMSNMHSRHELISHSIQEMEEINTKVLAQRISAELKRYSIPQAVFAQRVLCRSQGTLSDLLRNPKPWSKLKSGRETFRRMWKWLQEPEFQRMSALRLAGPATCKRKEPEQIKPSENRQPKKPRLVFTDIQRRTLHAIFKETKRPSKEMQSTIAQQLGLEVSTVANFFMNARRRSLDKWQEDTSKASSTANSPSDSPYSRSGQGQQSSNNNNLCYAKDEDTGNCTAYSPPSRRQPGHSLPTSASIPTNKTSDINFIPGNRIDLGRITHNNSLAVCSSFTKPSTNLIRTATNNNNNGLFTALQRRNNPGSNLNHSGNHTFNVLNNADSLSAVPNALYTSHQQEQQTGTQDLPNSYPVHLPPQIQHPPQLHNHHQHHVQGLSHPLNRQTATAAPSPSASSHQLTYPMDTTDRNENCAQAHSNGNINLDNHIRESVYPYNNSHINYVFPVTGGLHSHHPPHINLLHTNTNTNNSISNTNINPNVNIPNMNGTNTLRNHFLMHDLTGSSQFDHRFLSTMTNGHRALTEQALELCSSLAAANAISLNNTTSNITCTSNTNHITNEKLNHFHTNSGIKIAHETHDLNNVRYNNNTTNGIQSNNNINGNNNNGNDNEDDDGDDDENINPLINNSSNENNHENSNNNDTNQQQHQLDLLTKTNLSLDECNQLRVQASNHFSRHNYYATNEFIDQMKQINEQRIIKNEESNGENSDDNMVDNDLHCVEDVVHNNNNNNNMNVMMRILKKLISMMKMKRMRKIASLTKKMRSIRMVTMISMKLTDGEMNALDIV